MPQKIGQISGFHWPGVLASEQLRSNERWITHLIHVKANKISGVEEIRRGMIVAEAFLDPYVSAVKNP